jgi:hypothetical protein
MVVHVVEPDEVRPLQVVLDEANYAAAPLVPSVAVAGALAVVYLETMTTLIENRGLLGRIKQQYARYLYTKTMTKIFISGTRERYKHNSISIFYEHG